MSKNSRNLMLLLVMFLNASILFAQTHRITGTVYDAETNTGLPGVTIVEKGTQNGTTTDVDGKFDITLASPNATIVASFIGYQKQEIPVNKNVSFNVTLVPEVTALSEIVVIGYGTQKKKVVTGAIVNVKSEEIQSTPVLRVEQAMQGRTAGVQVTNLSGQPGEAPTIRIRGAGTTGNSDPLYIVDGMAIGGIDYLNPGDIESIEVLKDAASAAIYGARAANGVILITTKTGTKGKMNISYSGYKGIQNVANTLDMLDATEYKMMMNEGYRNSLPENAVPDDPFDLNEVPQYDTDWQDLLFVKNAPIESHDVSVSGGNEKSTYMSSLAYFSQQGIIGGDKSQFDRISARLNTNHQVNSAFRFGNNLSYSHIIRRGIASNSSFNGAYSSALNMDPLTPLYETNPEVLAERPYSSEPVVRDAAGNVYGISRYVNAEVVNPLALLEIQTGETRVDKVVGNIFGELEILKGLKFNTNLGVDLAYVLNDSYDPLYYLNGAQLNDNKTRVRKNINRFYTWQWENTLSYSKKISNHNFSLLGGTTARKENFENLYGFNTGVPILDPNHVYLNMATDTAWDARGGAASSSLASIFGRILYDYKDRYAFTGIIRRDGSSKFGANNRYGIFPSIGVSWIVSDEPFFPNVNWMNSLKFRASWGVNGNQEIGNYQFISTIDKSRGYIIGNGRYTGASPSYIENQDIHWEESEQIDIALDLEAFNNKLVATVDYYVKETKGLLERIPIPGYVGNEPPFANVGSVKNSGVEVILNWRQRIRAFNYSVGINGAYNKNEMTKIGNDEGTLPGANWAVSGMVTRTELGLPIAYFFGYQTDGIFQTENDVYRHDNSEGEYLQPNAKPGDVRFVDVNGDGAITVDDRTIIGNPTPDFTFGLNASITFKNIDFSMLLNGTYGNEIFNGSQRRDLQYTNMTVASLERWTGSGTSNETPRFTWSDVNQNNRVSDLYIEDGSFLRLKNIQIGYSFPQTLLSKIGATVFRLYISGENLITITNYSGADPEIGALSSFDIGIDRGIYPQARTFRVGTTITF